MISRLLRALRIYVTVFGHCFLVVLKAPWYRSRRDRQSAFLRRFFLKVTRHIDLQVRVEGVAHLSSLSGPVLLMANHTSLIDIVACYSVLPEGCHIRMLAKQELSRVPILGWAMSILGFVFVDRKDRVKARASLRQAEGQLTSGVAILLFPEGTRSKQGTLLPLKKGGFHLALQSGAHVVPIRIVGASEVIPGEKALAIVPGKTVTVWVGEPIASTDYSVKSLPALMDTVRQAMLSLGQ